MKLYLIIFTIVLTGITAKAQSVFKTNESISSQLKNGTAPGLVYSKVAPVKKQTTEDPASMGSSGKQIRNNALPGVVGEKKTAGTKLQTDLSVQPKSTLPLASDKPAEKSVQVEKVEPPKIVQ